MSKQIRLGVQLFSLLLIALLVFAACGGGAAPPAEQPAEAEEPAAEAPAAEEPAAEEEVAEEPAAEEAAAGQREIVWMVRTNVSENPWEQDLLIPAWEKEYPDIKVNLLIIDQPDIAVKREAMIAAGEPLHVWSTNWGGDGFASDRSRGLITDLTPLIEKDNLDLGAFIPEVLEIYKSDGKIWGLPFLTTGSYVFYNMKLFDEAGIEYPPTDWEDKSWTWDKMIELGKQLTKNYEDPTTAQYGWIQSRQNIEGPAMIFGKFPWPEDAYETGFADSINLTDPEIIAAYQKHHDLIFKEKVSPDDAASQALATLGGAFESGRVAMMQNGGWGWWIYSKVNPDVEGGFCWGVAPNPWGTPDAETRAVIYTDPWVITAGLEGQDLEDAWTFVKFLVREDNARTYMEAGNVPPTQTKLQEEWFSQFECMDAAKVKEVYQGAFAHGLESSNHMIIRFDELNQIWGNSLNPYFQDPEGDAAEVLGTIEQDTNDALELIMSEEGGQ